MPPRFWGIPTIDAILREDEDLRREAEAVMGATMIDKSIVIYARDVSGVHQINL
jgi:hypothetical protein